VDEVQKKRGKRPPIAKQWAGREREAAAAQASLRAAMAAERRVFVERAAERAEGFAAGARGRIPKKDTLEPPRGALGPGRTGHLRSLV